MKALSDIGIEITEVGGGVKVEVEAPKEKKTKGIQIDIIMMTVVTNEMVTAHHTWIVIKTDIGIVMAINHIEKMKEMEIMGTRTINDMMKIEMTGLM